MVLDEIKAAGKFHSQYWTWVLFLVFSAHLRTSLLSNCHRRPVKRQWFPYKRLLVWINWITIGREALDCTHADDHESVVEIRVALNVARDAMCSLPQRNSQYFVLAWPSALSRRSTSSRLSSSHLPSLHQSSFFDLSGPQIPSQYYCRV